MLDAEAAAENSAVVDTKPLVEQLCDGIELVDGAGDEDADCNGVSDTLGERDDDIDCAGDEDACGDHDGVIDGKADLEGEIDRDGVKDARGEAVGDVDVMLRKPSEITSAAVSPLLYMRTSNSETVMYSPPSTNEG